MDECLFCKIIKGDIPSNKIYEDKEFLVFLDIGPVNKGHTLVVPKKHYVTFLEMNEKELGKMMKIVQKIANAVIKGTKAQGFNIMINNKRAAGQLVDHVHLHIIPRFENDGFKHWPQSKYKEGEASKIADEIKSFL
jgi:histidine triad (HIT) family protein